MRTRVRNKNLRRLQKYPKKKQKYIRRKQHSGFLNRHCFAYAGQDSINQAINSLDNLAPKLINKASKEIDKI